MALGIAIAAVLLASAPIYSRAMADEGLTFTIRNELRNRANSRVEFFHLPLKTAEGVATRGAIEQRITERIGWFRADQDRIIRLGHYTMARGDEPLGLRPNLAEPQSLTRYANHVRVLEGTLPAVGDGSVIEVAVSARSALTGKLRVGDVFEMREQFDNCERELPTEPFPPPPPPCPILVSAEFALMGKLTAIIEPIDPSESFWVGTSGRYFDPYNLPIEGTGPVLPMLTDERNLIEGIGGRYPGYLAYTAWLVTANPEKLTRTNFLRARDDLVGLYGEFEPLGGFATSPLRDTLIAFGKSADYQETPLAVLLLEITGIALFYVALVAAIVVERQAGEIALLRGRGASMVQILSLYLVQGLVLGIPAVLLAPFVAAGMTALLGLTPIFSDVTHNELLPVTIVPRSFAMAAGGVALSMFALVVPALISAFRGPGAVRRSSGRPGASFFQRYYLDVALAAAAALLLIELRERGSVFTPTSTGGLSSDPLLLASPALSIAAAGALILRFYPIVLRWVSWATRTVAGASMTLGLSQMVRNSGQYTRLTLLLMMAVAVGTFAASYTSTADRSYRDRANYEAGVDLRATDPSSSPANGSDRDAMENDSAKLPGVTHASVVVRTKGSIATPGSSVSQFQVLGLDPKAAGEMLWTREDFAARPLADVLNDISGLPPAPGKALPANAVELRVSVRVDDAIKGMNLRAGMRDSKGQYMLIALADLEFAAPEWTTFGAPLVKLPFEPVPPFSVVSLVFTGGASRPTGPTVYLDNLTAVDSGGNVTVLEDFEGTQVWSLFPSAASTTDQFSVQAQGGNKSGKFAFRPGSSDDVRGIYVTGLLTPIPAVVSESFVGATGAGIGGVALLRVGSAIVPMQVRGTFKLFPTTNTRDGPVIIFNRARLIEWGEMAGGPFGSDMDTNELWLSLAPDADIEALSETVSARPFVLTHVFTRAQAIETNTRNPLIAASGSGILYLAFIAVLLLVASALLTSLLASIRRRRVEFAVVRAIGLSRLQLLTMLTLEYSVVFVVGVSAGCALGLFVSGRMLSFLDVTETGERVEPAFIIETEWLLVAIGVLVVLAVFAGALWLASRIVGRTADAQALRTE
jgi:ABC-type lipoprotein release transport system permease subunit